MPTKRNRAGNQQNYVEAGHGDASGEYGDNATGSNKHIQFTSFKKPSTQKAKIRKVVDDLGISTYYKYDEDGDYYWNIIQKDFERNPKYKNEGWKLEEKEIDYDEEATKKKFFEFLDEKVKNKEDKNTMQMIAQFKNNLSEDEKDQFEYFLSNQENVKLFQEELSTLRKQRENVDYQNKIAKGKEALSKFPKIKGDVSVDDNIVSVNKTNYDRTKDDFWFNRKEYEKYHQNCQKCAQTFELRMRGYDVEALERPLDRSKEFRELNDAGWDLAMYIPKKNETFEAYGNKWFIGDKRFEINSSQMKPLSNSRSLTQKKDIERIVTETGDGSRFQCSIAWKNGGAHVFNIINDKGKVRFIDSQSGEADVSRYFDTGNIKPKSTMLIRVDNLDISDKVNIIAKGR